MDKDILNIYFNMIENENYPVMFIYDDLFENNIKKYFLEKNYLISDPYFEKNAHKLTGKLLVKVSKK